MKLFKATGRLLAAMGIGTAMVLSATSTVSSAERIEFFVGPFEPVIWVDDLETLAQDGTVTERFSRLARFFDEQELRSLRSFLNASLDVDLISISQVTYWQVGERFLDRMGQVIQTDSFLNGSRALRAALIAAAADGEGITVLELLQEYPLDIIQLDFSLVRQIIQEHQRFFASRESVFSQLRTVGETEAPPQLLSKERQPTQAGAYLWQQETLVFENPLRDGSIPFDVYLPRPSDQSHATGSTPVIVISHGVASGRDAFR
ncbi:MAG: alpha/beta hydrolase, partial [Cyanobacteria bacterium P01_F01_bin.116]